jgi:hypothetical protein
MLATNSSLLKTLKESYPREGWSPPKDERIAASSGFIVSDRPRLREALRRKAQAQQSDS